MNIRSTKSFKNLKILSFSILKNFKKQNLNKFIIKCTKCRWSHAWWIALYYRVWKKHVVCKQTTGHRCSNARWLWCPIKHYKIIRFNSDECPLAIASVRALAETPKTIIYANPPGSFLTRMTKRDVLIPQDVPHGHFPFVIPSRHRITRFHPDHLFLSSRLFIPYIRVYIIWIIL